MRWFDTGSAPVAPDSPAADSVDWTRILPFAGMHLACLGVLWVGASPVESETIHTTWSIRYFRIVLNSPNVSR